MGINLPPGGPQTRLVACDVSRQILGLAARRRARGRVMLVQTDAQRLPFANGSFPAAAGAGKGAVRAAPGRVAGGAGAHTGERDEGWLTRLLDPLWQAWSRECHLDRETTRSVAKAGFILRRVERYWWGIVRVSEAAA